MKIKLSVFTVCLFLAFGIKSQNISPTDSIIYHFGVKLDEAFQNSDTKLLEAHFDSETFFKKILIEEDNEKLNAFNEGFSKGNVGELFGGQMIGHMKLGAYYNFINYYSIDSTYYVIFRLYTNGALNYHEYLVDLDENLSLIHI